MPTIWTHVFKPMSLNSVQKFARIFGPGQVAVRHDDILQPCIFYTSSIDKKVKGYSSLLTNLANTGVVEKINTPKVLEKELQAHEEYSSHLQMTGGIEDPAAKSRPALLAQDPGALGTSSHSTTHHGGGCR